ncbi:FAD/NAD(P)-binding domain-containing protein [Coniochaeta ligniaria NRRL 30616]|uniref:FAD/NAD(P)-binding domain-containing protein n=1 Tax=Coniochaeta ligniaria NRRL 30616 TaxID=1408157 RepID=A0A1J7JL32_9PEZI|nr:FAD/NAD(P)-binding domain-containing protein [Coniochaeta ligniaria NRRL 30616]
MGRFDVKTIAVIGAGPCGLSAAKYLLAQKAFDKVDVYEQQPEVGGVWNYSPEPSPTRQVPQVSAFAPPDPPVRIAPRVLATPMYDVLHTNIPRHLMKYSDLDFPKDALIFPSREDVQDYLIKYSQDVRHIISFNSQINDVRLRQEEGKDRWDVEVRSTKDGCLHTRTFDAVVVASGHYSTVFIPDVKNIKEFNRAHPGVISHSKSYRSADAFAGKKVIVVGNAASGLDIASQISRVCKKPLLLSVRTPSPPENLAWVNAEEVPVIEEFLVAERGVRFQDGRVERDIDAVLYATGYLYTFPFLQSLIPPLVTDGRRVRGIYKDLIHTEHPTLVFPGLPIKVVPFPLSESQAAIYSRLWANVLPLPEKAEMHKWEEEEAQRRGASFHVWPKGGDAEYINETHAMLAKSKTPGKEPPLWNDELLWQRKIYAEAKLKFEKEGRTAKSLEELGFHYRPSPETSEQEIL